MAISSHGRLHRLVAKITTNCLFADKQVYKYFTYIVAIFMMGGQIYLNKNGTFWDQILGPLQCSITDFFQLQGKL